MMAAVLIVGGVSAAQAQFFASKNANIGQAAPEFETQSLLTKKKTSLSEFRGGKQAVIFFWATWCPHCREAFQEMDKDPGQFAKKDIKLILVDVEETAKDVQAYVDKYKIASDVLLDQDGVISEKYDIIGVPTFFFVNQAGAIKDVQHELPDNYEQILSQK